MEFKTTAHIISHSHWDREWYMPFEKHRYYLVKLMDTLELATAMESRGYRGGEGRTKYRQLSWKTSDSLLMVSLGALAVMLFLLRS